MCPRSQSSYTVTLGQKDPGGALQGSLLRGCPHSRVNTKNKSPKQLPGVVFQGCRNKRPQTGGFKTTDMYFLPVLEARSLR